MTLLEIKNEMNDRVRKIDFMLDRHDGTLSDKEYNGYVDELKLLEKALDILNGGIK